MLNWNAKKHETVSWNEEIIIETEEKTKETSNMETKTTTKRANNMNIVK